MQKLRLSWGKLQTGGGTDKFCRVARKIDLTTFKILSQKQYFTVLVNDEPTQGGMH